MKSKTILTLETEREVCLFGGISDEILLTLTSPILEYNVPAFGCERSTQFQILQEVATGYFENEYSQLHVFPAIKLPKGFFSPQLFLAYDSPYGCNYLLLYCGTTTEISKWAEEALEELGYPYGSDYRYHEGRM